MSGDGFQIKICGITTAQDALDAVDAGATALGFNFYPRSPRYIGPDRAAEIVAILPGHVLKVGVFVDEPIEAMKETMARAGLDVAQLHGKEAPHPALEGVRVWKAFRVDDRFDLSQIAGWPAEAILLDSSAGGSGCTFDWHRATGIGAKIVLAGGLDASNVAEAIRTVLPWGVDSCSRLEFAPGRKDCTRVRAFVQAAMEARQLLDYV